MIKSSLVVGPLNVWPDPESAMVAWLMSALPGVNVTTETDNSFGTDKASPKMVTPLVLVASAGGSTPRGDLITRSYHVDLQCFATDRKGAWKLSADVHAAMLAAIGRGTVQGVFDDVWTVADPQVVNYSNPSLRRVITTYGIATRAQATA